MQKLFLIQPVLVLLIIGMPILCMKNDRMIKFAGDFSIISVRESNLQLMKAWNAHYQKHKKVVDNNGIVPLFVVSAQALSLVNDALNVGPYKFQEHYHKLSLQDKRILIKASGQYGDDGKTTMLNIPELTKQLVGVCLPAEVCQYIKNYLDDEDCVRNYFREKLIGNKGLLGASVLKQPMILTRNNDIIRDDIYPSSLFLDGYHTNHCESPIPLAIAEKIHQTYATHFVTDRCEYRIADIQGNKCNVWVIDHNNINNPNYTFSTAIEHAGTIKGCCFSKTGTGVEYAVTYSDCDIVITKITTQNDVSFVESMSRPAEKNSTIVDVCFNHTHDRLIVGKYKGMNSCVASYTMDFKEGLSGNRISFKKHGLLEKMFIGSNGQDKFLLLLFGVAGRYAVHGYKLSDQGAYNFNTSTTLMNMDTYNAWNDTNKLIKRGNSIFMYDFLYSLFKKTCEAVQQKSKENWFIQDLVNSSVERFDSECYRVYSPDGKFLLCNTLTKKSGTFCVETVLKDAVTHKQILTIDTPYDVFLGVGFTYDGTELIFLNHSGLNYKVLLLNDYDKEMVRAIEDVVFKNIGITSLLKRLCMECKANGILTLCEDDPARTMLMNWARKSPVLHQILTTCLPFYKIKK